jgi:hypothetical protein
MIVLGGAKKYVKAYQSFSRSFKSLQQGQLEWLGSSLDGRKLHAATFVVRWCRRPQYQKKG